VKKKIFRQMICLVSLGIFLVSIALCIVFYGQFTSQARLDLQELTQIFRGNDSRNALLNLDNVAPWDVRVTIITKAGEVIFDNTISPEDMSSHLHREEIEEALLRGEGESHRFSETLGTWTYYYAVVLNDDTILRTSKTIHSIWLMYARTLPITILTIAITIMVGYFLSRWRAQKVAEPMENMRKEFSANVSHELKTPLTSIYGNAEMLKAGLVKETDKPLFYEKIMSEVSRLINLVEDIIMLSKLDENKALEISADVVLWEVANECKMALEQKAMKHQVDIQVFGAAQMKANHSSIYELFYNLMDNAIKYNNFGGKVSVNIVKANGRIEISVADTGIGVSKVEQKRIFERFYRVDKSRSKQSGGTGLGLAIVKHIVLAYGGIITIESEPNQGTTFVIGLPDK